MVFSVEPVQEKLEKDNYTTKIIFEGLTCLSFCLIAFADLDNHIQGVWLYFDLQW